MNFTVRLNQGPTLQYISMVAYERFPSLPNSSHNSVKMVAVYRCITLDLSVYHTMQNKKCKYCLVTSSSSLTNCP